MPNPSSPFPDAPIAELLAIMARLRDPESGCPWDVKQNFDTIVPYTVEEAFEVAEAVARRDYPELREELGDLLLQVVFHSQMAREQGLFDFQQVVAVLNEKLIRRHPHVFGDQVAADEQAVKDNWEAIKQRERADKGRERPSAMDGVPDGLPALPRALKLQKKAAKVGFDWRQNPVPRVRAQVDAELAELDQALATGERDAVEDEFGDVLFTLGNLARHLKLDPDLALRRASDKFERRFRGVENVAEAPLADLDEDQLDALWKLAKKTSS
ncbi:nucleoside triphosphate pyrophosphohydrolase [Alcanivorax sp. N3-2A]|nr:nucleoside triphosphate pyrophosphohydrolase [Alcanivorax sp. N3-2A]|tara:strand:- start:22808 stop:23617 length:810 start_codon:yes stop_codon:yes gene_type:complete